MNTDTLYSYYLICSDGTLITENLRDHSKRVMKHLSRLKSSPISRYVSMKCGVSEDTFVSALLIAGALHDVGKAFYQRGVRGSVEGCRYLSFMGHEWISAYFIHQLWKYLAPGVTTIEKLMDVIFYAVLLHHHAMDIKERKRGLEERLSPPPKNAIIKGLSELGNLIDDYVVRNAYLAMLSDAVNNVLKFTELGLADLINEVFTIYRRTLKEHVGIKGKRVLYLVATAALVTADYLAAGEVRGPSRSRFWGVVKEFSNTYFRGA